MSGRRPARPDLVVRVPSREEFLDLLRDVTRRMAEVCGFDSAQVEQLAHAVADTSTQVSERAYPGADDRVVELCYFDQGGALRIDIVDDGARIDTRKPPGPALSHAGPACDAASSGAAPLDAMDAVTFHRLGRRNVCRLVKRKPSSDRKGVR